MATDQQKNAYYASMKPYAEQVQKNTGIPAELVVAWWSWETDYGTNQTSKDNNQAGITKGSKGRDGVRGAYATYKTMDSFVEDYSRLININAHGYPAVIAAAKAGKSYADITRAHNASAWSEADYNVDTIVSRANAIKGVVVTAPKPKPPQARCPACQRPL